MVPYVLIAVLGPLAFWAGRALSRRGRRTSLSAYAVLLIALVTKAVLHHRPDWEHAMFPWPDYVPFQVGIFFPLALLVLGLATGLLRGRNRRAILGLAIFVWVVGLYVERWLIMDPDGRSMQTADASHHCRQTRPYSCGPASAVSVLSQLGVHATEGEMMRLCRTPTGGGTSLFRIAAGMTRKLGGDYDVRIVSGEANALRALGVPAVVAVNKVHAIAVTFEGDEVVLRDPAVGVPRRIPFREYQSEYGGFAVVALPRTP